MLLVLGVVLAGVARPKLDRTIWVVASLKLVLMPLLAVALVPMFDLDGVFLGLRARF